MNAHHRNVGKTSKKVGKKKTGIYDRFLSAVQETYQAYLQHGPRSNKKLKILHGWMMKEISEMLSDEYTISGLTLDSSSEKSVEGMYYPKKVDILVARNGQHLGVISIKFVQSNYNQNKNNYFEQQLGETANLRSNDIVFGHMIVFTEPIPYYKRDKSHDRDEHVTNEVIERYSKLLADHQHPHSPNVQALCIVLLSKDKKRILRICDKKDLPRISPSSYRLLKSKLSIRNFVDLFCQEIRLNYAKKAP